MTWIRADDLAEGMTTGGGLEIRELSRRLGFVYVTWHRPGERKRREPIQYFPDQQFDIRDSSTQKEVTDMAQRVEILVESDLSGQPGAETVSFALDGTNYEVDLTDKEQEKFRKALSEYVGVARQVKGANGKRKNGAQQSGPSAKTIRAWAAENGVECPERGRIPAEVREAYQQAS